MSTNVIIGVEGNQLEILGMTGLKYSNGRKKYFIDSELLTGKEYDIVIFQNKIKFLEVEDKRTVDEMKKREIMDSILELLNSKKIRFLLL